MASISSRLAEVHLQDTTTNTTTNTPQKSRDQKHSKNTKALEEGKVLRKKIRHLRREDEKQAKSLTQDLKDIRESLSDINNLNKVHKETVYGDHSTRTRRAQEKHYPVKSKEKREAKNPSIGYDNPEEKLPNRFERETTPSQQQKVVKFEDGKLVLENEKSEDWRKDNKTVLSLSSIDLK